MINNGSFRFSVLSDEEENWNKGGWFSKTKRTNDIYIVSRKGNEIDNDAIQHEIQHLIDAYFIPKKRSRLDTEYPAILGGAVFSEDLGFIKNHNLRYYQKKHIQRVGDLFFDIKKKFKKNVYEEASAKIVDSLRDKKINIKNENYNEGLKELRNLLDDYYKEKVGITYSKIESLVK